MARKGKSNRRYSAPRSTTYTRGAAPKPTPASSPVATKTVSEEQPTPKSSGEVDFRSEYRYVLSDLKRIGILAAAMFATLIGLAVILP